MVAEHIEAPQTTIAALSRLAKPDGHVIVYTVHRWSPAALLAAATPMAVHHWVKRMLWSTAERDTFPTFYRMNTRRTLRSLFEAEGFIEQSYLRLDDTRILNRWKIATAMELQLWHWLHAAGLAYPEACIMGIYRKTAPAT
jgi:2-polyprenyl-3-methyl-5-hydroxy-6-metoxy-1,4-benzoquinol methylase